jgi:zinc protease
MMDEGTTERTSHQIAEVAEGMGASLSTSSGWEGSYVSFRCLSPHLGETLDLVVDLVRNPTFPEVEWKRVQAQTLAGLAAERDNADARAHRGLLRALYPEPHPYELPIHGDETAVARLSRADLVAFHLEHHGPARAGCVIAGDFEIDALARALEERLSGWTGPSTAAPEITRTDDRKNPLILVLDRPGAVQVALAAGHTGITRRDPDYTTTLVLNHILGGLFTSRLNAKLREEKGVTYSVRSHFEARRGPGPFVISASLQTDRIAEALEALRHELVSLRGDRPPSVSELDDARRSLIEGQARHFETPSALVSRYSSLFVHGLPIDDHARLPEQLEAVTVDSLLAVAQRQLRPDALVIVLVADASRIAGPLQSIDWAETTIAPP